jgi:hypothetical protein
LQVLATGQCFVDGRVLPGKTDDPPHGLGLRHNVVSIHPSGSRVGFQQGGQNAHERGFSGTVRSE